MKEPLSHRQLQSLIQVSNVLNSSLEINTIIDSILEQTVSVIEAAHGGVLFLYDKNSGFLIANSNSHFKSDVLAKVRLRPGESMTGLAFSARECLIFPNKAEVLKATSTLSEENLELMLDSIPNIPFSTICAPIFLKNECIGVITLDSFDESLQFIPEDINLLQAITHQAAVALEKASLYREQEQVVRQLEILNDTITRQNETLSRSVEIHNSLADLVLNGEGMQSIIDYLHQTIGYQIFLFDDIGELISSATAYPFTQDEWIEIKNYALHSMESSRNEKLHIQSTISQAKHLVFLPIGSKPKLFGSLAITSNSDISEIDLAALEHACTVISLEIFKEQAVFDAQERTNGELIASLSSGKVDETIMQKALHLGFDSRNFYMAVIIQLDEVAIFHKRNSIIRHLMKMSNSVFLKNQIHGITSRNYDQIIIVLAFQQMSTQYVSLRVKELVALYQKEIELKNWGVSVSIGIGRIHSSLLKVSKSLQEAVKCLQFIRNTGKKNTIVSYRDLGVQRLMLQNSDEDLKEFIEEVLGPIIEYDQNRKGDLFTTLKAYLDNNQNAKEAAESLHIHTNTLMYRLKRIEEILSINLANSQQFLNIHLATSLYPTIKEKLENSVIGPV